MRGNEVWEHHHGLEGVSTVIMVGTVLLTKVESGSADIAMAAYSNFNC